MGLIDRIKAMTMKIVAKFSMSNFAMKQTENLVRSVCEGQITGVGERSIFIGLLNDDGSTKIILLKDSRNVRDQVLGIEVEDDEVFYNGSFGEVLKIAQAEIRAVGENDLALSLGAEKETFMIGNGGVE